MFLAILLALVSFIYSTVGQAGGTAFLAILAVMDFPVAELRPTALALNVVAATYTTYRLHGRNAVDWRLLAYVGCPSVPASFFGGLLVLESEAYFLVTGVLLIFAAGGTALKGSARPPARPKRVPAAFMGAAAGFVSGVTGVGGGVIVAPALIALGWCTAKQAAGASAPFILANSVSGLAGALLAGQQVSAGIAPFVAAVVAGAVAGTFVGHRFMTERATRYVLAGILLFAGLRLLWL